jgi:hypothetical protein
MESLGVYHFAGAFRFLASVGRRPFNMAVLIWETRVFLCYRWWQLIPPGLGEMTMAVSIPAHTQAQWLMQ